MKRNSAACVKYSATFSNSHLFMKIPELLFPEFDKNTKAERKQLMIYIQNTQQLDSFVRNSKDLYASLMERGVNF